MSQPPAKKPVLYRTDELQVIRNDIGEAVSIEPKDPRAPKSDFIMPSPDTLGGVAGVFTPNSRQAAQDAVMSRSGETRTAFSMAALRDKQSRERRQMGSIGQRVIEISDDEDAEEKVRRRQLMIKKGPASDPRSASDYGGPSSPRAASTSGGPSRGAKLCWNCDSPHHTAGECHVPSYDGSTPICPYHGVPASSCRKLAVFEDSCVHAATTDDHNALLPEAFTKFVVERIRKPFCRVIKEGNCPIRIAIDYSNQFCNGQRPLQLQRGWPYTKQDTKNPAIAESLKCEVHNWEQMPKGYLENLSWEQIKAGYENGTIPRQIHSRTDPEFQPLRRSMGDRYDEPDLDNFADLPPGDVDLSGVADEDTIVWGDEEMT
ncbi:hypothetical protein KVR01_004673 [Diaporthe batatas]|uniref:uncharacterized protein n=1 Tax=Diaporthe batatas TaxID=748121 RepID=UPI001D0396D4|nr:uncharacterized protein KVR01_004673 [Diaporthe batatas]KAG8166121.1 hypothetical protein KVR01_004673 [Diaporthe batatas]